MTKKSKPRPKIARAIDLKMRGYEVVEKVAMPSGTSARVLVPRHWIGKRVRVVRLDP
jgi:putative transposon-encoded protein